MSEPSARAAHEARQARAADVVRVAAVGPGRTRALTDLATVQPGVTIAEPSRAVEALGLFYPPDPASWESSTIGGNVATNAGGSAASRTG